MKLQSRPFPKGNGKGSRSPGWSSSCDSGNTSFVGACQRQREGYSRPGRQRKRGKGRIITLPRASSTNSCGRKVQSVFTRTTITLQGFGFCSKGRSASTPTADASTRAWRAMQQTGLMQIVSAFIPERLSFLNAADPSAMTAPRSCGRVLPVSADHAHESAIWDALRCCQLPNPEVAPWSLSHFVLKDDRSAEEVCCLARPSRSCACRNVRDSLSRSFSKHTVPFTCTCLRRPDVASLQVEPVNTTPHRAHLSSATHAIFLVCTWLKMFEVPC